MDFTDIRQKMISVRMLKGEKMDKNNPCPCVDCDTRKAYALMFDIHISGEDCPHECEKWKRYKEERKNDEQT